MISPKSVIAAAVLLLAACSNSDDAPRGEARLSLNTASTAFGRVVSEPAGIDCPERCAASFPAGEEVVLRAEDSDTAVFERWGEDCGEARECRLRLDEGRVQSVHFAAARRLSRGQWRGGDTHVHSDHSSDGSLPRQINESARGNVSVGDQITFAERTGTDFLSITDHRTFDQHYHPEWFSEEVLLVRGEEANGRPHATVQGGVERVLQQASNDVRALQQSIWDARAQGAVWITAHPDRDATEDDGTPLDVAAPLGVGAVEIWNIARDADANIAYAETMWNRGYRFGVVAASDNHFRELRLISGPGTPRTSLRMRELREVEALSALAAGHSRLSASAVGPTLSMQAAVGEGETAQRYQAGDEIFVPAGTSVALELVTERALGTRLSVFRNPGRDAGPLTTFTPTALMGEERFTLELEAEEAPAWYRAELRGPGKPDSPLFTVENLVDGLAEGNLLPILETVGDLPGQLRAATPALFVSEQPPQPDTVVPLPADSGGDDGARLAIGSRAAWSGFPDVAAVGEVTHIVAEARVDGRAGVHYRRDEAGEFSGLLNLAPDSASARQPRVAARGDTVWVVWQDERAGEIPRRPAIMARASFDGGRSWEPETIVRAVDGRAEHPDIALDRQGRPVIVWQEIGSGRAFDVWAQVLGRDAEPVNLSGADKETAAANAIDTRSARWPASLYPAVSVAGDGSIAVVWQDNRSDPDPLFTGSVGNAEGTSPDDWAIFSALRGAGSEQWQRGPVAAVAQAAQRFPAVVHDNAGMLHLAWERQALSDSGTTAYVQATRLAPGAGEWQPAQDVAGSEAYSAQRPALGLASDGAPMLAWMDAGAEDWRWRIGRADFDGARWAVVRAIDARGNNTWPAVAEGQLVFAGTRNARRLQRDATQQIFLRVEE